MVPTLPRWLTLIAGGVVTSILALAAFLLTPWPYNIAVGMIILGYVGGFGIINIPVGHRGVPILFGGRLLIPFPYARTLPDGSTVTLNLIRARFELSEGWNWLPPMPFMGATPIDCREQSVTVPSFTVNSRAPANVRITVPSAVIRYLIVNPAQSLSVTEAVIEQSLIELAQQVFRSRVRELDDQEALDATEELREQLQHLADDQATEWGVDVRSVLLGELSLPPEVQTDYERLRREERQRDAERIELTHIGARVQELTATGVGLSPTDAIELIQTERAKVVKTVDEKKINVAPATIDAIARAIASVLPRRIS